MQKIKPQNNKDLKEIVQAHMEEYGNDCNLNHIDISDITDMKGLFRNTYFNGDISKWDTSNVVDMSTMFTSSRFNGDISKWDVSKVVDMKYMFNYSDFNQEISDWKTYKLQDMQGMFAKSKFDKDISMWKINQVENMEEIFKGNEANKPWWAIEDYEKRLETILNVQLKNKLNRNLTGNENSESKELKKIKI